VAVAVGTAVGSWRASGHDGHSVGPVVAVDVAVGVAVGTWRALEHAGVVAVAVAVAVAVGVGSWYGGSSRRATASEGSTRASSETARASRAGV
jgi:hypothetical protein